MSEGACFYQPSLHVNFIHLSSKAPWVIESCYITLLVVSRKLARLTILHSPSSSDSLSTTHTHSSLFYIVTTKPKSTWIISLAHLLHVALLFSQCVPQYQFLSVSSLSCFGQWCIITLISHTHISEIFVEMWEKPLSTEQMLIWGSSVAVKAA